MKTEKLPNYIQFKNSRTRYDLYITKEPSLISNERYDWCVTYAEGRFFCEAKSGECADDGSPMLVSCCAKTLDSACEMALGWINQRKENFRISKIT